MASKYKLVFLLLFLSFPLFSADLLLRVFDDTGAAIDSVLVRGDVSEKTTLERAVPEEYSGPGYRVGVYFADAPDIELYTLLEPMDVADYADQAGWAHIAATALDASGSTWADSCDTANFAWYADSARISESAFLAVWADTAINATFAVNADSALYADSSAYADTAGYALNSTVPESVLFAQYADSAGFTQRADSCVFADTAEYARNAIDPDSVDFAFWADSAIYADSAAWADSAAHAVRADTVLWSMFADYTIRCDSATYADTSAYADTAEYALNSAVPDSVLFAQYSDTAAHVDSAAWADSAGFAQRADSCVFADTAEYARNSDTCSYDHYFVVAASCGDFDNLTDALAAIPPGEEQWVIKLMPGNYNVPGGVTLPTLVTLKGDGPDVVSLFLSGSFNMAPYSGIRDVQFNGGDVHLQGGNMLQNCIMDTTTVYVDASQSNAFDRVAFRGDASYIAVDIAASAGISLASCVFTDCQIGIDASSNNVLFRAMNCIFYSAGQAFNLTGNGATGIIENCLNSGSTYSLGLFSLLQIDSPSNAGFGVTAAPNVLFLNEARYTNYTTAGGDWSWTAAPDEVDEALDKLADQVPAAGRDVQADNFGASERVFATQAVNLSIFSGASATPFGLSFAPIEGDMIIWNDTSAGNDYKICIYVGGSWECADTF